MTFQNSDFWFLWDTLIFREQRTYVLFGSSINPSSQQIKHLVWISSKFLCRFNRISRCDAKKSSFKTLKAQIVLLYMFFFICRVLSEANREPQKPIDDEPVGRVDGAADGLMDRWKSLQWTQTPLQQLASLL